MKVTIKGISYVEFMGLNETLTFNEKETTITRPNKGGKTRLYNGFLWVICGKNSKNETRFDVESYGVEKPNTKVTVTLDVDGTEITLAKGVGKWWYNGLEVKKNVYEDFISQIYNVETLELLSNPLAFMQLHWETRRNYLTSLFCEKVAEDSEFSFLMKSMSISDIRKSKTQAKKIANDGLKRCSTVIEVYENNIAELKEVDYDGLRSGVAEIEKELKELEGFNWNEYHGLKSLLENKKNEYNSLVAMYKKNEFSRKTTEITTGDICLACGSKMSAEKFEKQKEKDLKNFDLVLDGLKNEIIIKRSKLQETKALFEALELRKPDENATLLAQRLRSNLQDLRIKLSKENDILALREKLGREMQLLDSYTSEVMQIESFMDRFNTFLTDNYFKSINDNFDGLFFDIENECKLTNEKGVEFRYFSLSETINAGMQIISVLSKKIGLQFPVWVDNRESVTKLYDVEQQVINLRVGYIPSTQEVRGLAGL